MPEWWVDEPFLRASGNPNDGQLDSLRRCGFAVIVSLLDERQQPPAYDVLRAAAAGWRRFTIPVPENGTASVEQMEEFVRIVRRVPPGAKALVHCQTGSGRSCVIAAAYWIDRGLPVEEAIARVSGSNCDGAMTERRQALSRFAARIRGPGPAGTGG